MEAGDRLDPTHARVNDDVARPGRTEDVVPWVGYVVGAIEGEDSATHGGP